ncbi:IS1182 family transposase [Candidatus Contendibacter odensensis]|uniref:Transposase n=1 Tax=Candidatus Contendobacter odensis Run_B_J11 TaxID=1400861 RepID=A0A7U7GCJ2_9GAMM|nr:IS1182 family transposase [Candidatus Contendobacter odensis]CDH45667.1 transposase [Candidatus Contendobacter odensis Run_B_J11]
MSRFRPIDRATDFLLPPSIQEWLPEGHLAHYVVEVFEQLDLSALECAYAGRSNDAYHPALLLSLLIYGYATGTFSSRKIERATYDSLAFRYIACNLHPDHDTLAHFRRRFGTEFQSAFVQVLQVARENQLARFGTVSLDGTKVHANASKHSALSYGHAEKIEAHLKAEVEDLVHQAEAVDPSGLPEGMSLPEELQRRQARLEAMAQAKAKIETRAQERFEREQADYEANMTARQAQREATGKNPGGKEPQPPQAGPRPDDPINLTDEESRIMPMAGGGFEQSYNAQALGDTESWRVRVSRVTQAANDKEQLTPMVARVQALPEGLNAPDRLLADNGYFSENNVIACQDAQIEPLIAMKREDPHPHWQERFIEPAPLATGASPVETLAHALKTLRGKAHYALRKQTVEPVFGIIKSVMGFRQFLLRGLENVTHEWTLVCLAWNLKRMAVLRP